jgi:quinol monooxygenase YgiN
MSFVVIAIWTALPGEQNSVASFIEQLIQPSRNETGNISYVAHRAIDSDRTFMFHEVYVDEEAYHAHARSEHFVKYAIEGAIPRLETRERQFYQTWL